MNQDATEIIWMTRSHITCFMIAKYEWFLLTAATDDFSSLAQACFMGGPSWTESSTLLSPVEKSMPVQLQERWEQLTMIHDEYSLITSKVLQQAC